MGTQGFAFWLLSFGFHALVLVLAGLTAIEVDYLNDEPDDVPMITDPGIEYPQFIRISRIDAPLGPGEFYCDCRVYQRLNGKWIPTLQCCCEPGVNIWPDDVINCGCHNKEKEQL